MKYWIFTGGEKNALFHQLMSDLEMMKEVVLIDKLPQIPAKYRKIWQLQHNEKLNRFGPLPFRNFWYSYMPFDEKVLREGEHCLIFNNVSAPYFEPGLLKKWKKKYRLKLVFYFLDVYDSYYARHARAFIRQVPFDFVYSFYQEDVRKYHFRYLDCYYSKQDVSLKAEQAAKEKEWQADKEKQGKTDTGSKEIYAVTAENQPDSSMISKQAKKAFFWGTDGGRRPFIEAVAERLAGLEVSGKFGICYTEAAENRKFIPCESNAEDKKEKQRKAAKDRRLDSSETINSAAGIEIIYNRPMEYPEIIKNLQSADVILDVVGDYSKGVSLRYFESFAYNKKLITNNPLVKQMRGYDPERILLIDSPSEISKEFIEKDLPQKVYDNRFSPVHFIEELEENW